MKPTPRISHTSDQEGARPPDHPQRALLRFAGRNCRASHRSTATGAVVRPGNTRDLGAPRVGISAGALS